MLKLKLQHFGHLMWRAVKCVSRPVVPDSATPWTAAHQAPLSRRSSRQGCWSGLPFPSPGDLSNPGIEPGSPALQADSLPTELPGKSWLTGKDLDAGKDWRQEDKGMTEDKMVGWHHRLYGHEFEQTQGDGEGQWSLGAPVLRVTNSLTKLSNWKNWATKQQD